MLDSMYQTLMFLFLRKPVSHPEDPRLCRHITRGRQLLSYYGITQGGPRLHPRRDGPNSTGFLPASQSRAQNKLNGVFH